MPELESCENALAIYFVKVFIRTFFSPLVCTHCAFIVFTKNAKKAYNLNLKKTFHYSSLQNRTSIFLCLFNPRTLMVLLQAENFCQQFYPYMNRRILFSVQSSSRTMERLSSQTSFPTIRLRFTGKLFSARK
jgi:hypothetical protein